MQSAATEGTPASDGSGRIAFEASEATLPGVSAPSSVVRSVMRTARSSANTFDSRLIERFASVAARSSSATASIEPIRGSRGSSGSSKPAGRTGACAIDLSLAAARRQTGARRELVRVVRVSEQEVGERHSQRAVLHLPDVAELVDDEIVVPRRQRLAQQ